MRPTNFTPCPAPADTRRVSIASTYDDTTDTIDFTRAVKIPPRRRSTVFGANARRAAIGNDLEIVEESCEPASSGGPKGTGKTLLSKPAMRSRRMLGGGGSGNVQSREVMFQASRSFAPRAMEYTERSKVKEVFVTEVEQPSAPRMEIAANRVRSVKVEGGARRRTIFVPSDDTTMLTIHPGANTTNRLDDTFQIGVPIDATQLSDENNAIKQKPMRKPKRLSLAAAPKRMPLGQMAQSPQGVSMDVAGDPTGKENVPPRSLIHSSQDYEKKPKPKRMSIVPDYSNKVSASNTCKALQQHPSPVNAASKIKREPQEVSKMLGRMSLNVARPDVYTSTSSIAASRPRLSMMNKRTSIHGGSTLLKDTISSRRLEMRESKVKQFPLLADKLYNPELHDDGWINHQENAITHIVNAVFREADSSSKEPELCQPALRSRMLEVFDLPLVVELNKRLQAALQYGILRPQVSTDLSTDRTRDLGLRKHFIGLWMNNYNENLLRAAAEVVVGRTIPQSSPTSRFNSGASLDPHAERRTLVLFLESFFIDGIGMDHHFDADATAVAEARERKTLQRSLMLIWLLDRTKGAGLVSTLLFKPKAQLKSSAAVIKHLGKMLIPNTPELVRALNMLDYEVVHVQLSLSEVNYHIDNIAVDLRDGIFLTRLVELVALDKKTGTTCNESHLDFSMPDGGMLSEMDITSYRDASTQHSQDSISILSRHLRLPCLGNAPKLHNIQLALNAFNAACCQDNLPPTSVEASDILNGHREKTLHLLWQLVSQYGLSQLVNMNELLSDIKQTGDDTSFLSSTLTACFSREDQEVLLQSWATVHAAERGTIVTNLTTSFASANVWSALCEAYSPFSNTSTESTSLESRLRALGCSLSWIQHLLSTLGRIPNRVTTLSNLGYFASVVLPLARRFRHVTTLQRVWRARQAKKMLSARIRHMRAGRDCAAVAKTQNMVVDAAVVIQRAWRGVVERRIERLNEDVVGFQALAKGWMGRRKGRANRIVRNAW